MINGHISTLKNYKGLNKGLDQAIDYLLSNDLEALPLGKTVVNDLVTITKLSYIGKEKENAIPEEHRCHLDMQIVLHNKELCYFDYMSEIDTNNINTPYNEEKDVIKYNCNLRHQVIMDENNFSLFTPDDVHQPGIKLNDENIVKLVIKVVC